MSFDYKGKLKTTYNISQDDLDNLGIDIHFKFRSLDKEHLYYLDYHQKEIFQE